MKIKASIIYSLIMLSMVSSWIILSFCSDEKLISLTMEDCLVEWLGFFFLFTASILFFISFIRDKNGNDLFMFRTNKNAFYLLLALAFFFAAGEEISWGQRIFSIQTADVMRNLNDQYENNIHNLKFIRGFLTFDHIFTLFWFSFCVLIPLLNLKSNIARKFLERINMPIVPIWLSAFYVLTYTIFLGIKFTFPDILHANSEVKETYISCLLSVLGLAGLLDKHETSRTKVQYSFLISLTDRIEMWIKNLLDKEYSRIS